MAKISRKVFVAPSVIFAFIDRAHPKHEQADAFFRYFAQEEYQVFTDIISINTVYTELYTDISPTLAKDYMRILPLSNVNIIYPDENEMKAAVKALVAYQSNELTFPAALRAVLSERRSISQICTLEYLHPLFGLTAFYLPI